MQSYHLVWLRAHPTRTRDWLQDRLDDGFDVHHVDGDRGNSDPANLILIEGVDHSRLHGMNLVSALVKVSKHMLFRFSHKTRRPARKAARMEKNKVRSQLRRRMAGAIPRSESVSAIKPWEADGMSRATWYRRLKAEGEST